jgi:hypothetical protein
MRSDHLQVEQWPIERLLPYAANARTHPEDQVAQIAASIVEFGFNVPCLVDERGVLVAGHGRLLAARRLGLAQVPVIRLAHLTDAQARAFRIADNQIALNAGWNEELLAAELARLLRGPFEWREPDGAGAALAAVDSERRGWAERPCGRPGGPGGHVDDAHGAGPQGRSDDPRAHADETPAWPPGPGDVDGWARYLAVAPDIEPAVCRGADGLAHRVDRLRLGGNGVVPLVAAHALRTLAAQLLRAG